MIWIKYIWILIMIYLVCSARTCSEDDSTAATREEENTVDLKDSVRHFFMTDTLFDRSLRGFEIAATEKLIDFADYMKIISDTTLDLKFRQHAAKLVRDLFISHEIKLNNWSRAYSDTGLYTLEFLLAHSLKEGLSCWICPLQINVSELFATADDSTFTGGLSFNLQCVSLDSQDTSDIISESLFMDIYLIKHLKPFGKDEFRVWSVYLGDVN